MRFTVRAWSCLTRSTCAASVFATTSSPLVSLSSRCTMPARGSSPVAGAWCSSAFSMVPAQLPLPGCTTSPAGLSITSTSSSSCTTASAMASGRKAVSTGREASATSTASPLLTLRREAAAAPSTVTWPSSISRASRLRDSPGQQARERLVEPQARHLDGES